MKMTSSKKRKALYGALSGTLLTATAGTWQAAYAGESADALDLDEIVVIGTPLPLSKIKTSSSISTVDEAALEIAAPTSAADALRSIPGIHSEASAGEGNTNVSVRGIPISAGGSRYISFQEDGLAVLLNGDYAFVTADMFMKLDNSLDHIEAVRGGSASTQAANSPGALINFITKDGSKEGGSVGLTSGLTYNELRWDWDYGQKLSDKTRFFVGGFYRQGEGIRNGGLPVEHGGQIRGNITHDIGDEGSYIRFNFKRLDDQSRLEMANSSDLSNYAPSKDNPATVKENSAVDPRFASYNSPYWGTVVGRDRNNNLTYHSANDGMIAREMSLGVQLHLALGHDWTVDENFRNTARSGLFDVAISTFGSPSYSPASAGSVYATGPQAGAAYTGAVTEVAVFDATLNDYGNVANAFKVSKKIYFGNGGSITPIFGWDFMDQKAEITVNMPHYLLTATGDQPAAISGVVPGTAVVTDAATGQLPYANGWGAQYRNVEYVEHSPYFNLALEVAGLNLDGGVRLDSEQVTGYQKGTNRTGITDTFAPSNFNVANSAVRYRVNNTEFTLGANYSISNNLAVFARYSSGASLNVIERLSIPVDGSSPEIPVNKVKQADLGLKFRTGGFSTFVTLFNVKTLEGNYDLTTLTSTTTDYNTDGIEVELGYKSDIGFDISGSVTVLNPKIKDSHGAGTDDNQPNRMPKWQLQFLPSYSIGPVKVGLSVYSQDKTFANDANSIILPSYTTIGLFLNASLTEKADVSISANNLNNAIGWTEFNGGYNGGPGARAMNGRSIKGAFRYKF